MRKYHISFSRSQDFCAFTAKFLKRSSGFRKSVFRTSSVHYTFARSCPESHATSRISCVHVMTFINSCPDFARPCPDIYAFTRILCIYQISVLSSTDLRKLTYRDPCVQYRFLRVHIHNFEFHNFITGTFCFSLDFAAFMCRLVGALMYRIP